jgi:dihydrofolate synthase/folylpolyglutamate synthase
LQVIPGAITFIYDVSHNPAAAEWLAKKIKSLNSKGKTYAVFSMLADKDIVTTLQVMKGVIDKWYTAPLAVPRGISAEKLVQNFQQAEVNNMQLFTDIATAKQAALNTASAGDQIIVFGSFHTVKEAF